MGAQIEPSDVVQDGDYEALINREYAAITPGNNFKMIHLRPAPDEFDFTTTDSLMDYAEEHGFLVFAHTLVWGHEGSIPDWLANADPTREELIAFMEDHITTVMQRYAGRVQAWDVVNEAFCNADSEAYCIVEQGDEAGMDGSLWRQVIGPDFIEIALQAARAADPSATIYLNENGVEIQGTPKAEVFYAFVADLVARGIPLDGVGMQMHLSTDTATPELIAEQSAAVHSNVARFNALGLQFLVTELDVAIPDDGYSQDALDWQAELYRFVMEVCLEAADCPSFSLWSPTDRYSWIPDAKPGYGHAGIHDDNLLPKPAYHALREILTN